MQRLQPDPRITTVTGFVAGTLLSELSTSSTSPLIRVFLHNSVASAQSPPPHIAPR